MSIIRARYIHLQAVRAHARAAAKLTEMQAAGLALRKRHEVVYLPLSNDSYLKFVEVPPQSPAFRGALAWAYRKPGRQVTFSRGGKPVGFDESQF